MIDSRNGSIIWQFDNKYTPEQPLIIDIYMANYIPDQDNDGISDILAAHTSKTGIHFNYSLKIFISFTYNIFLDLAKMGHLIVVSGRSGEEIKRVETPNNSETFYPPQVLYNERDVYIIFGTGSPTSPGNLSAVSLREVVGGYLVS